MPESAILEILTKDGLFTALYVHLIQSKFFLMISVVRFFERRSSPPVRPAIKVLEQCNVIATAAAAAASVSAGREVECKTH